MYPFLPLRGLKSSRNSSRLINRRCEWTIIGSTQESNRCKIMNYLAYSRKRQPIRINYYYIIINSEGEA